MASAARVSVVPLASLVARAAPTTTTTTAVHAPRRAIIVLHGIFGSKQNWTSLTKAMARATATDIYALDLRNHGDSPHHPEMTYEAMARDVAHFVEREDLDRPLVVGHSMGGKVAMQLALEHADKIAGFMSLDMSPLTFDLSRAVFPLYLSAMQLVQKANVEKMSQADKILKEYIPDLSIRQFLLTNLKRKPGESHFSFRIPLSTLRDALPAIGGFPSHSAPYRGPTAMIGAIKADYLHPPMLPEIRTLFPTVQLKMMESGHWIHAERPVEIVQEIASFYETLDGKSQGGWSAVSA
ncbi:hypothetical protein AMAG_18697 [Allomyces macrogynus ATCC 38327]|uniref:AB hydrolase-1 domain-containing protein n=1 Tax=Allomyces macrogynus (strain ATCC 38327) TaxID=578462 RepID=A0A0L0SE57_ALLM3|nr:hypothetical protein AMAG_18697 [Allomyces macrogynus ATCC 38327]|eukprot:KNE60828.1 hypothetical protein AMAG_18697 [Allomyces macrogynus ATCC 38327]